MAKQTVALLGLGTMGSGMASNLQKAGFPLRVYNRTREKAQPLEAEGALVADTPEEAASGAAVVLSMLSDDHASKEIWLGATGALRGMKLDAIAVECSTVTPRWVAELKQHMERAGFALLDAPVTGSRMQAAGGQLSFLVGGDPKVLEKVWPVLDAMSQSVTYVGPTGSAARLKLVNNFLCGVQLASIAEAMSWVERSGLDREAAFEFLKRGAPGSPMLGAMAARMMQASYEVNFQLCLMKKDMDYAASDAEEFGLDLRTIEAVRSRLEDAVDAGWSDKDMSSLVEPIRAQARRLIFARM